MSKKLSKKEQKEVKALEKLAVLITQGKVYLLHDALVKALRGIK